MPLPAQVGGILIARPLDILVYSSDRLLITALHATLPHVLRWAQSLEGCVRAIRIERPDVVVLDLEAVSRPGYVRHLQRVAPRLPLAVWVPDLPVEWAVHAIEEGLLGIFLRSSHPEAVFHALAAVAKGERVIDPAVLAEIVTSRSVRVRERHLTIAVLAERFSNKEIAEQLACSTETVKQALHILYNRLRVRGRPELATVIARNYGEWHGTLRLPSKLVLRRGANLPTA